MSAAEATSPDAAAAGSEPAASAGRTEQCVEHFIPLRKTELVRRLVEDQSLHNGDTDQFQQWCRLLTATVHYQYHDWLEDLKDLYAPVNPDSITRTDCEREPADPAQVDAIFDRFTALFGPRQLSPAEPRGDQPGDRRGQ